MVEGGLQEARWGEFGGGQDAGEAVEAHVDLSLWAFWDCAGIGIATEDAGDEEAVWGEDARSDGDDVGGVGRGEALEFCWALVECGVDGHADATGEIYGNGVAGGLEAGEIRFVDFIHRRVIFDSG